jgi:2,3-diketo-5-methylthiopentyl-1-phosphate enolase
MIPGMVRSVVEDFGCDTILGVGAGIHAHPMGPRAGAMAHRQALDAVLEGRYIREAAKTHPQLAVALDLWGVTGEADAVVFALRQ